MWVGQGLHFLPWRRGEEGKLSLGEGGLGQDPLLVLPQFQRRSRAFWQGWMVRSVALPAPEGLCFPQGEASEPELIRRWLGFIWGWCGDQRGGTLEGRVTTPPLEELLELGGLLLSTRICAVKQTSPQPSLIAKGRHLPSTWAQGMLGTPEGTCGGCRPGLQVACRGRAVRIDRYNEFWDFASHHFQVRVRISSFV